jgi:hypothetical protein
MKKHIFLTFLAVIVTGMMTISAAAIDHSHSVWTNNSGGRILVDPDIGCEADTFFKFRTITSWTEITPGYNAQAHFRGFASFNRFFPGPCGIHTYEFVLNSASATSVSAIDGSWDVYRDGTLLCSACTGSATGLNQAAGVGNFYDLVIDDPVYGPGAWVYSGLIDVRDDF